MADVAIVGIGQTTYETRKETLSLQELIFEAASLALADAGVRRQDLDSVVLAAKDLVDGRGISNMQNAGPAGSYLKDEIRVANDGLYALILAYMQIVSGSSNLALVVSWSKCSETNLDAISVAEFEPFFQRPVGLSEKVALALQAHEVLGRFERARAAASETVCRARAAALHNARAHLRRAVTRAEVEASEPVSWPLRQLDLCPASDGACALVLAARDRAATLCPTPAWILGVGWSSDGYEIGERSLSDSPSARRAADEAYRGASLASARDIDVVELVVRSSFQEMVVLDALGLCAAGEADRVIVEGRGDDGALRLTPSGGALASNPVSAVGLVAAAEVASQVMGRAGGHQVDDVRLGLAHGTSGQCLQSNGVVLIGAER